AGWDWMRFFFSSRRRHTRFSRDWSSDVCSSDLVALEQPTQSRQALGRPDRLDDAAGDGTSAGLLQTGLENQAQRRLGLAPAIFRAQHGAPLIVEIDLVELLILAQVGLGDVAELIAWQARHRLAQRAYR